MQDEQDILEFQFHTYCLQLKLSFTSSSHNYYNNKLSLFIPDQTNSITFAGSNRNNTTLLEISVANGRLLAISISVVNRNVKTRGTRK